MAEIEDLKIAGGSTYTVGNQDIIAKEWEASKTYVKDKSYVTHEHKLYVCNTTHTSVEPFDVTKWTEITIGDAIANNTTAIGNLSTLTTTEKSSLVGAVNEVDAKATMSTGSLTSAVSAVTVSRGNFWRLDKMIFACGAFTLGGSANAGLSLLKFPTGVTVPSTFDMACYGADNKVYNCYAYLGNIVANATMPAQVYTFNFVARTT